VTTCPPDDVVREVERALADGASPAPRVHGAARVSGGCISPSARLTLEGGTEVFLKWSPTAPEDMFTTEAAGLDALRGGRGLRIPEVLGLGTTQAGVSWLLLEFIPAGQPTEEFWSRLALGLVDLHRTVDDDFGWAEDNYIGSLPQANRGETDWASFWWLRRLEPQLRMARNKGFLLGDQEFWQILERDLPAVLDDVPDQTASLLHGDLWSGNVYASTEGDPVVIDPAVYLGHAEVDIAMTELFGGFAPEFHKAYNEAASVSPFYEAGRRDLYQLYPLMVHVNLFGGSYEVGVQAALGRAIRLI